MKNFKFSKLMIFAFFSIALILPVLAEDSMEIEDMDDPDLNEIEDMDDPDLNEIEDMDDPDLNEIEDIEMDIDETDLNIEMTDIGDPNEIEVDPLNDTSNDTNPLPEDPAPEEENSPEVNNNFSSSDVSDNPEPLDPLLTNTNVEPESNVEPLNENNDPVMNITVQNNNRDDIVADELPEDVDPSVMSGNERIENEPIITTNQNSNSQVNNQSSNRPANLSQTGSQVGVMVIFTLMLFSGVYLLRRKLTN